jgi:hypothetical protein
MRDMEGLGLGSQLHCRLQDFTFSQDEKVYSEFTCSQIGQLARAPPGAHPPPPRASNEEAAPEDATAALDIYYCSNQNATHDCGVRAWARAVLPLQFECT